MLRVFRQGRKTILFILILCATAIGMTSFGVGMYRSPSVEKPAIKVGDIVYTQSDVFRERRNLEDFYRNNFGGVFGDVATQVVDSLVNRAAQDKFLAQFGFEAGRRETQQAILSLFEGQQFSPQMFGAIARSMGYSAQEYEALIEKEVKRNSFTKLLKHVSKPSKAEVRAEAIKTLRKYTIRHIDFPFKDMKVAEPTNEELEAYFVENATKYELPRRVSYKWKELTDAKSLVEITDDDIEFFYAQNQDLFRTEPMVRVDMINFPLSNSLPEKVKEKADSVLAEIKSGADFIDLALKYSPNQKSGFVKKSELPKEVANKVFEMTPGEVSDVIRDTTGFYIVRLNEKKESEPKPLAEVRDEVIKKIQDEQLPIFLSAKMNEIPMDGAQTQELTNEGELARLTLQGLPETRQLHQIDGKFFLVEVIESREPELPGLSEVKANVLKDLKRERQEAQSLKLAKESPIDVKKSKAIEDVSIGKQPKEPLAQIVQSKLSGALVDQKQEPVKNSDGYSVWWVSKITEPSEEEISKALKEVEERKISTGAQRLLKELTERVKANTVVDVSPMVFAE